MVTTETTMVSAGGNVEHEFKQLEQEGNKHLLMTRCEEYAGWTLPYLFMPTTAAGSTEQQYDYQSLGARCVNHLANKLVFALFNPTRPFFKLDAQPEYKEELEAAGINSSLLTMLFSKAERQAMSMMMKRRIRTNIILAMKHIIVTGNGLLYVPPDGSAVQVYNLRDYVVRRDLSGEPVLIITKDHKKKATLPENIQKQLPKKEMQENVVLYTRVVREGKRWKMTQAVDDVNLDSSGEWDKLSLPWIPITWELPRGYQYGVGLVEQFSGAFNVISILSEALTTGGAISADIKRLVDPTGVTDVYELNNARSGEYVSGRAGDITTPELGKSNDLTWVANLLDRYERTIGQAFLLNSAVTRDAERVTAEEIRRQAQELETSLGGVHSALADDLQTPLAYLALRGIDFNVDGKKIEPLVITGMDALQRENDADNLMMFFGDLAQLASVPEPFMRYMKPEPTLQYMAANRGVDYETFLKKEQEVQAEVQAEQQAMMQQQGPVA